MPTIKSLNGAGRRCWWPPGWNESAEDYKVEGKSELFETLKMFLIAGTEPLPTLRRTEHSNWNAGLDPAQSCYAIADALSRSVARGSPPHGRFGVGGR